MLVPVVLAANTSPVWEPVNVTVIEARFAPSSVTVALAASVIATAALPLHEAVKSVPAAAPLRSTVGAELMTRLIVAVAVFPTKAPSSVAVKLIVTVRFGTTVEVLNVTLSSTVE